jgi:hypothetical protein
MKVRGFNIPPAVEKAVLVAGAALVLRDVALLIWQWWRR